MLNIARGASALPMAPVVSVALSVPQVVAVQPERFYFVAEPASGRFFILYEYVDGVVEVDGELCNCMTIEIHKGRCTGEPVVFSRLSDAERLCRVLNGYEV